MNGSTTPGAGGDLITYEGWDALGRPEALKPLADDVYEYDNWEARCGGTREQWARAITAEAERLLAGPWPPLG
ncbi:hypothetical protein ACU4GG_37210 [Streptomyces nojiriensis]